MSDAGILADTFDCVVMFTWSNWKTEPRSNRYHYAMRLAKHLPVLFVQVTDPAEDGALEEPAEEQNITIVHLGTDHGPEQAERLRRILQDRGVRSPLYWVYNPRYDDFIGMYPGRMLIYHATEDYLADHKELKFVDQPLKDKFLKLLTHTDLVVAVSEPVAQSIAENSEYAGPLILLRNGCDAEFWRAAVPQEATSEEKIVFFQGGVNARLDFDLVHALVHELQDWQFWFCGDSRDAPQPEWNILCSHKNVWAFGPQHPDRVAALQARATVGIIPFRQVSLMQISLPLKAFEYVASGLPVVTIPISELERHPDLFQTATDAKSFAEHIRAQAPTRWEETELARRFDAANAASYDLRFEELVEAISTTLATKFDWLAKLGSMQESDELAIEQLSAQTSPMTSSAGHITQDEQTVDRRHVASRRKRILVTYSASATHVQTTSDYLLSLSRHLDADVKYLHVTHDAIPDLDFSEYDAVFQSYCARWPFEGYVSAHYSDALARYNGLKILAVQDEYDRTNVLKQAIIRHGFDVVLTCVPTDQIEKVYPRKEFPNTEFIQVLTGYVPEDISELKRFAQPLAERTTIIGYRGRDIGGRYGRLAWEKLEIGRRVRDACAARGLRADIDWTDQSRIYGKDWFKFLGSCRATLGTESGSNVFDFDGSIEKQFRALTEERGEAPSYEEFMPLVQARDASMDMGQISPKVFEAIAVRTPLILMRGRYSGVVRPEEHYIPLELDYSNLDDVLDRLSDLAELEKMTTRAYEHVVGSGAFGYPAFVKQVNEIVDRKIAEKKRSPPASCFVAPFVDPGFVPDDRSLLLETATDLPVPNDRFWLNIQKRQTNIYRREVDRLNAVYGDELKRLNAILIQQSDEHHAETSRLNAELSRLGQRAATTAEQAAHGFQLEAEGYKSELQRVWNENVELRKLMESDAERLRRHLEEEATSSRSALAKLGDGLEELERLVLSDFKDRPAHGDDPGTSTRTLNNTAERISTLKTELAALRSRLAGTGFELEPPPPARALVIPPAPSQVMLKLAVTKANGSLAASALGAQLRTGTVLDPTKRAKLLQGIRRRIANLPGLGPLAIWVYKRLSPPRA